VQELGPILKVEVAFKVGSIFFDLSDEVHATYAQLSFGRRLNNPAVRCSL
jgi:hypothetical protein